MQPTPEGTRRLRAAVRTVLSSGVWLVVAAQAALLLVVAVPTESNPFVRAGHIVAAAFMYLGLLYLIAGASRALAASRDAVSITAVLTTGKSVFVPFMWLVIKALGLAVALQLAAVSVIVSAGMDPSALAKEIAPYVGVLAAALEFILVYWRPLVFVDQNFALFQTLRHALRLARERLRVSGYLALLNLTPAAVAPMLGADPAVWIVAGVNLAAGIMGWIAYVYCVEWCQERATPSAQPLP